MTVWTLTKDTRTLRCDVERHPLGQEVRLYAGDELGRSQVARDQDEMLDLAVAWRAAAEAKGWAGVVHNRPLDS